MSLEGVDQLKNRNDLFGNRTRDLPAFTTRLNQLPYRVLILIVLSKESTSSMFRTLLRWRSHMIEVFTNIKVKTTLILGRVFWIWTSYVDGYEEFYFLGHDVVYSIKSRSTFRTNISPLLSGSKNKPSKKQARSRTQAETAFCWFLTWRMFQLRKSTLHIPVEKHHLPGECTVLCSRRKTSYED
jgi:hypothetical protein